MAWFGQYIVGEEDVRFDKQHVDRWLGQIRPLPLPPDQAPRGGIPLIDVPEEALLKAPPQLIAHTQRTAAQGGLQIVSPRQVPITGMMVRVKGGRRELGDHVVGCVASPGAVWPTLDGTDFSKLLPDEPLCMSDPSRAIRKKTKALPLTKATSELSDPILSCLVTGRAVIDVLRRPDVMGGAEEMTNILANAWQVGREDIDDLDAFTIGIDGPLHRHAIKTDDVFPMCYAPIHVRRAISVSASDASKELLPLHTALDWRRMRMHCEAVFALAASIEGIPLPRHIAMPPPGEPSAPTDRPEVLVFRPAPATAWTYDPATFSVYPNLIAAPEKSRNIPRDVLMALTRYTSIVKPMSFVMAAGMKAIARRSMAERVPDATEETIMSGYNIVTKTMVVGGARGKRAASAVRNIIYKAIESANEFTRLRLVRYITIAEREVMIQLNEDTVPNRMIQKLADKFLALGSTIRLSVVAEAARRGKTTEKWWGDILSQAPEEYKGLAEGSRGWAVVGLWLMFREPTENWHSLKKAMKYSALRDVERRAVGGMPLPPKKGSPERLLEAARCTVKRVSQAYSGYYMGVHDVAQVIADLLAERNQPTSAKNMREAAYLWCLRGRCLRGTNVKPLAKDADIDSPNHLRVYGNPIDIAVTPAPYRAFNAYRKHLERTDVLFRAAKIQVLNFEGTCVSSAFRNMEGKFATMRESQVTRYILNPQRLGVDMERAWAMLAEDVRTVARMLEDEAVQAPPSPKAKKQKVVASNTFGVKIAQATTSSEMKDYFEVMADLTNDQMDTLDEAMAMAGREVEAEFESAMYSGPEDLMSKVERLHDSLSNVAPTTRETVG